MYLVVGLGNPGDVYTHTRHNTGAEAVSLFRERHELPPFKRNRYMQGLVSEGDVGAERVALLLPETFMNRSGESVRQFLQYVTSMPEVVVVHDELDLPLGRIKISYDRGAGGHNGVASVIQHIGGKDFTRVRIGIGVDESSTEVMEASRLRHTGGRDYVLERFRTDEMPLYEEALGSAVDALTTIVGEGREAAMQKCNAQENGTS